MPRVIANLIGPYSSTADVQEFVRYWHKFRYIPFNEDLIQKITWDGARIHSPEFDKLGLDFKRWGYEPIVAAWLMYDIEFLMEVHGFHMGWKHNVTEGLRCLAACVVLTVAALMFLIAAIAVIAVIAVIREQLVLHLCGL